MNPGTFWNNKLVYFCSSEETPWYGDFVFISFMLDVSNADENWNNGGKWRTETNANKNTFRMHKERVLGANATLLEAQGVVLRAAVHVSVRVRPGVSIKVASESVRCI